MTENKTNNKLNHSKSQRIILALLTIVICLNLLYCGSDSTPPIDTKADARLSEKIKILSCNCKVEKVMTEKGEYIAGVQMIKPKYEDSLKCNATFLNNNEKKIDTGFEVTWDVQTKTGALVAKVSESVDEFLPPKLKVNWDVTRSYKYKEDEIADIKKRKAKVECSLAKLKEVD